ncbi:MAG: glycoside hydrolase family 25 protein [Saprospiraceae bacterium]|nr:glycoside hydrolase family 25 protein [Saprospiraceae bacterium]
MKRLFFLLGTIVFFVGCDQRTERKEGFGVHGIDVSHYQSQVDWPLVASQNVQFAFVKATEGQSMQDSVFCNNWDAMRSVGLLRGAYHFFRPSISAELQAWHFIASVDLQHGDLPPVLDVEVTDELPSHIISAGVKTWLSIVGEHWKIRPIVYTNQKFYNRYLAGHLPEYPIWVARYTDWNVPELADGHPWHFWQYGCQGRLPGIQGDVDFNVFNGSLESLQAMTLQRPLPLLNRMPEPPAPMAAMPPPPPADNAEPVAAANP